MGRKGGGGSSSGSGGSSGIQNYFNDRASTILKTALAVEIIAAILSLTALIIAWKALRRSSGRRAVLFTVLLAATFSFIQQVLDAVFMIKRYDKVSQPLSMIRISFTSVCFTHFAELLFPLAVLLIVRNRDASVSTATKVTGPAIAMMVVEGILVLVGTVLVIAYAAAGSTNYIAYLQDEISARTYGTRRFSILRITYGFAAVLGLLVFYAFIYTIISTISIRKRLSRINRPSDKPLNAAAFAVGPMLLLMWGWVVFMVVPWTFPPFTGAYADVPDLLDALGSLIFRAIIVLILAIVCGRDVWWTTSAAYDPVAPGGKLDTWSTPTVYGGTAQGQYPLQYQQQAVPQLQYQQQAVPQFYYQQQAASPSQFQYQQQASPAPAMYSGRP